MTEGVLLHQKTGAFSGTVRTTWCRKSSIRRIQFRRRAHHLKSLNTAVPRAFSPCFGTLSNANKGVFGLMYFIILK